MRPSEDLLCDRPGRVQPDSSPQETPTTGIASRDRSRKAAQTRSVAAHEQQRNPRPRQPPHHQKVERTRAGPASPAAFSPFAAIGQAPAEGLADSACLEGPPPSSPSHYLTPHVDLETV